jgi:hypothetical protein
MAVAKNEGSKKVVGDGKKLYTGLVNVLVVAINPTLAELESMGVKYITSEPEYTTTNDIGKSKTRIDIWVKNPELGVNTKFSFWVEDEISVGTTSGKAQFINKIGQTSYAFSVEETQDFFDKDGARPALKGEADLVEFIRQWANVEAAGEVSLDTIKQIAAGDVKELKDLVKDLATNGVKILLGVKDGKYQTVYTKMFGRPYQKSTNMWTKKLNDSFGQFKADYQNSLDFKEYEGALATPDVEKAATQKEDAPF